MDKKQIPCEVYSRIVGYYRPIRQWNRGAQKMHEDRKYYTEAEHDPIGQSGGDRDGAASYDTNDAQSCRTGTA